MKIRNLVMMPISACLLPGCGEPESSRFVPAKENAPGVSSSDRPAGEKASSEATIPKNIPMH